MDLKVLRKHRVRETAGEYNRYYQRIHCLVCDRLFIYWYEKKRVRLIDSVEQVEALTDEEKLERWATK